MPGCRAMSWALGTHLLSVLQESHPSISSLAIRGVAQPVQPRQVSGACCWGRPPGGAAGPPRAWPCRSRGADGHRSCSLLGAAAQRVLFPLHSAEHTSLPPGLCPPRVAVLATPQASLSRLDSRPGRRGQSLQHPLWGACPSPGESEQGPASGVSPPALGMREGTCGLHRASSDSGQPSFRDTPGWPFCSSAPQTKCCLWGVDQGSNSCSGGLALRCC